MDLNSSLNLAPMSKGVASALYGASAVSLEQVVAKRVVPKPVMAVVDKPITASEAKKIAKEAQVSSANLFDILPGMSSSNPLTHAGARSVMKSVGSMNLPGL